MFARILRVCEEIIKQDGPCITLVSPTAIKGRVAPRQLVATDVTSEKGVKWQPLITR